MRRLAVFLFGLFLIALSSSNLVVAHQVKEAPTAPAPKAEEKKEEAKKDDKKEEPKKDGKQEEAKKEDKPKEEKKTPSKPILPGLGGLFGAKKEAPPMEPFNQDKADIELLKTIKVEDKPADLLDLIHKRTLDADSRARLLALIAKLGDDSFQVREQAFADIEKFGPIAVPVLRQNERGGDPEIIHRCMRLLDKIDKIPTRGIIAAVARRLAHYKPEGTVPALLNYLPLSEEESVVTEIKNALQIVHLKDGKPDPDLLKAADSPDLLTRGMVLEIFSKSPNTALREQMKQRAAKEENKEIRLSMLMGLIQVGKDKLLVPEMIKLMGEVPLEKGWRAEEMLCRLGGEKSPSVALGSDETSRKKASEAWAAWWKTNGDKVNLARLDEVEQLLGFTLSVEVDPQTFIGRVIEYGPDKKERWSIKNLNYPTDAILMPGDKVMIAEQNSGTISLRDCRTGKPEWTEQMYQPVSLQRLQNGNVVVGCRNQIFEWDPKRKQVFQFDRSDFHDVAAAAKLPNGNYVFMSFQGNQGSLQVVDKDHKIIKTIPIGQTYYWGSMQVLSNNRVLVTQRNGVAEYDLETKKSVWTINAQMPFSVQRLPTGNVLVAFQNSRKIAELDRDGKESWSLTPDNNYRPWRAKRR